MAAWQADGASVAMISGRFRVLRSALGWAHMEEIIERNPLRDMRGPPRPGSSLGDGAHQCARRSSCE